MPRGKDAHVRLGKHDGHHSWGLCCMENRADSAFHAAPGFGGQRNQHFYFVQQRKGKAYHDDTVFQVAFAPSRHHTSLAVAFGLTPTFKGLARPSVRGDETTWNLVTTPLVIAPQIIFIIITVLEIQQWRLVVNSSDRLRSIRNNPASKWRLLPQAVMACIIFPLCFIFVFVMACSFAAGDGANTVCADTWTIYSLTFMGYLICFGLSGLYYSIKLGRMIYTLRSYKQKKSDFNAGKTVTQKQKAVNKLQRVQRTVITMTCTGILAIAVFAFRTFEVDVCCDPDQTFANSGYLIFISVVHVGECVTLKQLLNTIKTIDYEKKRHYFIMGRDQHVEMSNHSSKRVHTDITDDMLDVDTTNVTVTD